MRTQWQKKWGARCKRAGVYSVLLVMPWATAQVNPQPLSKKPIRIMVPFGAGGVADVTSRVVAQQLSTQMGQPVIIENKPSAGGIVAADTVVKVLISIQK